MPDEIAKEFASHSRTVVVAAAGCGKTELIARAVASNNDGRQLVLTHTHAGVRALRDRLRLRAAKFSFYTVDTIAGFSLRYATSFPVLSGCRISEPCTSEDWVHVYEAAKKAFHCKHVRNMLSNSYAGLFVDEYQDCTRRQDDLIMILAELLPTRIVGDPLQGIFEFSQEDPLVDWSQDIYPFFSRLPDLETPYRWIKCNNPLGQWLTEVRKLLLSGEPIRLETAGPAKWVDLSDTRTCQAAQITTCLELLKNSCDSVAVIRKWPQQAHATSKVLKGRFRSMEEMECKDLLTCCERLEGASGIERARIVVNFALDCMTKKPQPLQELIRLLHKGKLPSDRNLKKHAVLKDLLRDVADRGDISSISAALQIIANMPEVTLHRKELFREMLKTMLNHDDSTCLSLRSTAWKIRDRARRFGRFIDPRVVSRTTLVKGLEFDHAVILNAADFGDAKNLYVALTRGARSLTVMSSCRTIQRPAPRLAL